MNKYFAGISAIAFSFCIWYIRHSSYADGYSQGKSEQYQEMLKEQRENNVDLAASNAYLAAQIEGMENAINRRNKELQRVHKYNEEYRAQIKEILKREKKWACHDVPNSVVNGMRSPADITQPADNDDTCEDN